MALDRNKWDNAQKWTQEPTFSDSHKNLSHRKREKGPVWCLFHETPLYKNYFTLLLGGDNAYQTPLGFLMQPHLDLALQNLERFEVVMLMERLEEQLAQLKVPFGWDISTA